MSKDISLCCKHQVHAADLGGCYSVFKGTKRFVKVHGDQPLRAWTPFLFLE